MSDNEQAGQGSDKDIPPWLQPVPEEEEATGFFEGRKTLVITAAAALSVVVLFVLVLLYLYDSSPDGPPRHVVADSTPIKVKPEEPGGMDVPNQDKQVFDQGAGAGADRLSLADQPEEPLKELPADPEPEADNSQTEDEARLAAEAEVREKDAEEEPRVAAEAKAAATEPEVAAEKPAAAAIPAGSFKVQLGAYGSEESAATAWRTIRGKHRAVLEGLSPIYESVRTGDRTLYRLRVGPLESRAAADEVCLGLRAQQQACIVVNP